uniref:Protein kinase domain-containing protein n=1 Tax=Heligmosomoides polygyrus TaxID=6339 RepID=A0A183FNF0_HELPZ
MFSLSTALRVSQQCLDACRDLHVAGYIHRDVKPANFAVGRNSKRQIIHMLDFGISRRYGVGLGESTKATHFKAIPATCEEILTNSTRGTLPYASVACHRFEELGPRDDCESWMYMLVDFLSPTGLPWKRATDHETVLQMKEEVREGKQAMFLCGVKCKKHLLKIITYIDGLKCSDRVDYSFIFNIIAEVELALQARYTVLKMYLY